MPAKERVTKHNYYLDIAETVAERSTCLRKKYGAIIVKNDVIISTGYNGAPRGRIIAAPRDQMLGSTIYMACIDTKTGLLVPAANSCMMCKRQVINAGIEKVIIRTTRETYRVIDVESWITDDDSLGGRFGY